MRFRISDGGSFAVEFEADSPAEFAERGIDAVIDARRRGCKRWHQGPPPRYHWMFCTLQIHVKNSANQWVFPAYNPELLAGRERENLEAAGAAVPLLPMRFLTSETKSIRDAKEKDQTPGDVQILRAIAVPVFGAAKCSQAWADKLNAMAEDMTARIFPAIPAPSANFGKILGQKMEDASVGVAELADGIGISKGAVYKLLSGDSKPTWETVQKLAAFLNVPTDAFKTAE